MTRSPDSSSPDSSKLPKLSTSAYDGFMNLGFPEMMFIFIMALILFGPKKLPEIGRQIGKGLAEFKRASREFQSQIEDEVRKLELETDLKNTIAPLSLSDTVAAQPPTLTVGATPLSDESGLPPTSPAAELPAVTPEPDYSAAHVPPKAESAGNA